MPPKKASTPSMPLKFEPMHVQSSTEQHVYHHQDQGYHPTISMKVERNSRGFNWEASVSGCQTVNGALLLLRTAEQALQAEYGSDKTPKPTINTLEPEAKQPTAGAGQEKQSKPASSTPSEFSDTPDSVETDTRMF